MASDNQRGWVGRGPVVSVRLEKDLIDRLDILATRTGRSRGTYLRMALWAMIPHLEAQFDNQSTHEFADKAIHDAFEQIIVHLRKDPGTPPPGDNEQGNPPD